ncbi:MAG: hypothetical protein IT480_04950 [Gammaproteobacteria bacterium]|nr:hypothetical protein [Gammaproteobacteria bacterium]
MLTPGRSSPADAVAIRQAAQLPCTVLIAGAGTISPQAGRELQQHGFASVEVPTVRAALDHQHREPCSIVISAEQLPDGTAAQLINAIRAAARSAYVYAIVRSSAPEWRDRCFDQLVRPDAGTEELLQALRAARRIVTLERVWRIERRANREAALIEQVSGRHARLYFLNELLHHVEQLQATTPGLALLLLRVEPAAAVDALLRPIVTSLFSVVATDADVIARLSPTTFGLLLDACSLETAQAARDRLCACLADHLRRDAGPAIGTHCAVATLCGAVADPDTQALTLLQAAEAQLPPDVSAPTAAAMRATRDVLASAGAAHGGTR